MLNSVLHFDFTMLLKQWAKEKRRSHISEKKKTEKKKQNSVTIMISADGKRTVFPVKLKLEGESYE